MNIKYQHGTDWKATNGKRVRMVAQLDEGEIVVSIVGLDGRTTASVYAVERGTGVACMYAGVLDLIGEWTE